MTGLTKLQEIHAAAVTVFARKGYESATMKDVAQELGLRAPSLYNHIESKQALLLQVIESTVAELVKTLEEAMNAAGLGPDERLVAGFEAFILYNLDNVDKVSVVEMETRLLDEPSRRRATALRASVDGKFRQLLIDGMEQGILSCEDPTMTVRAILTSCGRTFSWYRPERDPSPEVVARTLARYFIRGLYLCNQTAPLAQEEILGFSQ